MDFYVGVLALIVAYAASGLALSWFLSRLKLINLTSGAVAGTAGYVFALVSRLMEQIWLAMLAGLVAGAISGVLVALLAQRLRDLEFAIASFAIQIVWVGIVANSVGWLGGPLGIAGVTSPPGSATFGAATAALLLAAASYVAVMAAGLYERRTPLPPAASVVARSTELANTLGVPTVPVIIWIGTGFGASMGCLGIFLATYTSFVGIQVFSTSLSIVLLALSFMAAARPLSAFIAASVLIGGPELLRLFGYTDTSLGFVRMALVGVIILASVPTALRPWLYETSDDN